MGSWIQGRLQPREGTSRHVTKKKERLLPGAHHNMGRVWKEKPAESAPDTTRTLTHAQAERIYEAFRREAVQAERTTSWSGRVS